MTEPVRAVAHIQSADRVLLKLQERAELLDSHDFETELIKHSETFVMCILKRSELRRWQLAATGNEVELDYDSMLDAADKAANFVYENGSQGFIIQYLPLLLMARAAKIRDQHSATGRLSLTREDTNPSLRNAKVGAKRQNGSWDWGYSYSVSPDNFDKPDYTVQVKAGPKQNGKTLYRQAGVLFLGAYSHGFDDYLKVIDSCLHERGDELEGSPEVFTPEELDNITDNIKTQLELQKRELEVQYKNGRLIGTAIGEPA